MANTDVTFSKITPAAPTDSTNVEWQTDGNSNPHISANVPNMTATQGGLAPVPPNDAGKFLDGTAQYSYPIGGPISGTIDLGAIPIGQADGSVIWADPTVQGVYADGASVATPGTPGDLSTIQPVLVAGKNASGNMQSLPITTNGIKTDGSAVTQPISASSLPLPTGASTSAKQPALGTAGSASSDVITVQGIASMTALKVDGSAVTQPISAASFPLPSGASTATNQATQTTALQAIQAAVAPTTSIVTGNSPAAGAEATITIPSGIYRIKTILFRLSASATVANRVPDFIINDPSGVRIYDVQSRFNQTASAAVIYYLFHTSLFDTSLPSSDVAIMPIPDLILAGGATISTSTPGLQAADQWTTDRVYVEKIG